MFENNLFNNNLIAKKVKTKNDAWGKHFYHKLCPQNFS